MCEGWSFHVIKEASVDVEHQENENNEVIDDAQSEDDGSIQTDELENLEDGQYVIARYELRCKIRRTRNNCRPGRWRCKN